MIYISHRGNIEGRQPNRENRVDYIFEALGLGYHVEVDVWGKNIKNSLIDRIELHLIHDKPDFYEPEGTEYKEVRDHSHDIIRNSGHTLIESDKIIWHCKNLEAVLFFKKHKPDAHYFFHDIDELVLTSHGMIWVHPESIPSYIDCNLENTKDMIAVLPENISSDLSSWKRLYEDFDGICSDIIGVYRAYGDTLCE